MIHITKDVGIRPSGISVLFPMRGEGGISSCCPGRGDREFWICEGRQLQGYEALDLVSRNSFD